MTTAWVGHTALTTRTTFVGRSAWPGWDGSVVDGDTDRTVTAKSRTTDGGFAVALRGRDDESATPNDNAEAQRLGIEARAEDTGPDDGLIRFAHAWANAVAGTSYLPGSHAELADFLRGLARRLAEALRGESFDHRDAQRIGAELVDAHVASAEGLGRTVETIHRRLLRDLGLGPEHGERLARLLAALVTSYTRRMRDRTLDAQESIRRADLRARERAERALRDSEARFRHQATHDLLTDLPNRALFTDRLTDALRHGGPETRIGLCLIDLDRFKIINDTLGHQIGDQLLVSVGKRLRQALGGHFVARLGVDEFAILMEGTRGIEDATTAARTALTAINEPALVGETEITISASIGVLERSVAGVTAEEVIRDADITLRLAKTSGGARYLPFDREHNEEVMSRQALSAAMPGALDRGEFFLDYQPLTSLVDGSLRGVEALVRWRHPELGVLGPDRFIGVAEETGLIVRLGGWVLTEACHQARDWVRVNPAAPYVSVNLAVRQVHSPGLADEVTALLSRIGLPPDRLQLEITESALMTSTGEPVRGLRTLRDLGVGIAIDDFGTGYSNLAYLRDLPVTGLKFAGSFVQGLRAPADAPDSHTDERILATLVSLAHALHLTVTAEGVETAGQADRLRAIGCDCAQGWHFGRPGPAERIVERLRTR